MRRGRETAVDPFSTVFVHRSIEEETPYQQVIRADEVARLIDGMGRLKPDQQRVIELRDFSQLSFGEIARRMNKSSKGAVQMLHARALAKLSAAMRREARQHPVTCTR